MTMVGTLLHRASYAQIAMRHCDLVAHNDFSLDNNITLEVASNSGSPSFAQRWFWTIRDITGVVF